MQFSISWAVGEAVYHTGQLGSLPLNIGLKLFLKSLFNIIIIWPEFLYYLV